MKDEYIKISYLLFYRNKMISGQLAGRAKLTIVTDMYFRILENVLSTEAHSVEKLLGRLPSEKTLL